MPSRHLAAVALLPFFAAAGCKKTAEISRAAYIVGDTNDIVPVDKDRAEAIPVNVFNGSALIATKLLSKTIKFCSGVLIEPQTALEPPRVVTNHHCFAKPDADGKATRTLLVEGCTATTVYLGFAPKAGRVPHVVGCKAGTLRTDYEGDLAVFTLDQTPPDAYQPLRIWEGEIPKDREAMIVHYPDVPDEASLPPGGEVKLPTAAATLKDCRVLGAFPKNEWPLDRTLPYSVRHTCDLIQGSSGSGLIDVKTRAVLGINWGGIKITYDGGARIDNVATMASYLTKFLAGEALDDRPRPAPESSDAIAAGSEPAAKVESKQPTAAERVRKSVCGTVGGSTRASFPLFLILTAPLVLLLPPRVRRRALYGLVLVGAFAPRGEATPLTPQAGWAHTYFLNTIFVAEYLAVMDAAEAAKDTEWHRSREARALFVRASFARAAAAQKAQWLAEGQALDERLKRHAEILQASGEQPLLAFVENGQFVAAAWPLLEASFTEPRLAHWQALRPTYDLPSPRCPLEVEEVRGFAAKQKALTTGGLSPSAKELLEPIATWPRQKVECLILTMMAATADAQRNEGYEPLPVLAALTQAGMPLATSRAFRLMYALRLFQVHNYAETLRILMDLTDLDPSYRLAYETVQRIFSIRQTGQGQVALKGL